MNHRTVWWKCLIFLLMCLCFRLRSWFNTWCLVNDLINFHIVQIRLIREQHSTYKGSVDGRGLYLSSYQVLWFITWIKQLKWIIEMVIEDNFMMDDLSIVTVEDLVLFSNQIRFRFSCISLYSSNKSAKRCFKSSYFICARNLNKKFLQLFVLLVWIDNQINLSNSKSSGFMKIA